MRQDTIPAGQIGDFVRQMREARERTEAWIAETREQYGVTEADMASAVEQSGGDPDGLLGALAEMGYPC